MQDDSEWDADDQLVTNNDSENSESSMDEPELPLAATDVQHSVWETYTMINTCSRTHTQVERDIVTDR